MGAYLQFSGSPSVLQDSESVSVPMSCNKLNSLKCNQCHSYGTASRPALSVNPR